MYQPACESFSNSGGTWIERSGLSPSCRSDESTPIEGILTETGTDPGSTNGPVGDDAGPRGSDRAAGDDCAGSAGAPLGAVVEAARVPVELGCNAGGTDTVVVTDTVMMLGLACAAVGCGACC